MQCWVITEIKKVFFFQKSDLLLPGICSAKKCPIMFSPFLELWNILFVCQWIWVGGFARFVVHLECAIVWQDLLFSDWWPWGSTGTANWSPWSGWDWRRYWTCAQTTRGKSRKSKKPTGWWWWQRMTQVQCRRRHPKRPTGRGATTLTSCFRHSRVTYSTPRLQLTRCSCRPEEVCSCQTGFCFRLTSNVYSSVKD